MNNIMNNSSLRYDNAFAAVADNVEWDALDAFCDSFSINTVEDYFTYSEEHSADSVFQTYQNLLAPSSAPQPPPAAQKNMSNSRNELAPPSAQSLSRQSTVGSETSSPSIEAPFAAPLSSYSTSSSTSSIEQQGIAHPESNILVEIVDGAQLKKNRRKQQNRNAQQRYRERSVLRTKVLEDRIHALEFEASRLKGENLKLREAMMIA